MLGTLVAFLTVAPNLYLIPTPQSVTPKDGQFRLGAHVPILVAKPGDDQDSYAAEGLITESPTSFGWGKPKRGQPSVVVGQIGRDAAIDRELKRAGLRLPATASPDGYILSVRPKQIVCAGKSAAGTYYAIQTLKQLIRTNKDGEAINAVDIVDWPALQIRGWQDDISRGPIPTLAFLKKQVLELSEYKLNAFTLYTEHVFRLKKHPTIAPKDGITAEEVKELDKFCRKHHVQLIGNFQSFGHFANILNVPGYEKLAETPNVITPAKEESYGFLKDVYDEIAPAYSSPLFNINCDETYGLGDGPAKEMVQKEGLGNVYAKHINRVASLLKAKGKTVMMWGDIALQYPDIRKNLPKDLIVLTWGYDPRDSFVDQIEPFTKIGFKFLVCPGVSCWGQVFPDLEAATKNISNFVRDGAANGALGMLNTTWDDTGENLFNNNWYPLVWGAEVSWKPAVASGTVGSGGSPVSKPASPDSVRTQRLGQFDQAFPRLFYGLPDGSLSKALWTLSDLHKSPLANGMSDRAFWKDLWEFDASQSQNTPRIGQNVMSATMAIQHARAMATRNAETLLAAENAAAKAAYLSTAYGAIPELPGILKVDKEIRLEILDAGTSTLVSQLNSVKDHYVAAWRLENRSWWLDRNLALYDRAVKRAANLSLIPIIDPSPAQRATGAKVTLAVIDPAATVHFTQDGSEPSANSPVYTEPIEITKSTNLRAVGVAADGRASPVVSALYTLPTRPAKIETTWNHYGDNAPLLAFDGLLDTYFWSYGSVNKDATFTLVLDDPDMIGGIKVTTGHPDHPDDWLKEGTLEVSSDGERWREVAKFEKGVAECGMIGYRVKAIRIKVGKDNGNWLVIREIELR